MSTTRRPTKAEAKKARVEAARAALAATQRRSRNIRIGLWSAACLVVVAIVVVVAVVLSNGSGSHPAAAQTSGTSAPTGVADTPGSTGGTGNPPWAAPGDASAAV